VDKAKPFDIPKREVWEAFKKVKANQGAAGVDGQSIADFEADLSNNLYKLWNRLSSGSYFPPPVKRVEIPKADGGTRALGIPTVAGRFSAPILSSCRRPKTCTLGDICQFHSMTSSAVASSVGGTAKPSAFAVVRLTTRSKLVGSPTGISPGFAPRRILSTISAARRNRSVYLGP
jgi:hypothetical protein